MKKIIVFTIALMLGICVQAQNKNKKYDIKVKGNCIQCKERIEKAAYGVKGVKVATWDVNTHNLHIILNETKNNVDAVENAIVAVGHDTENKKSNDKAYEQLPLCCLYNRQGIDEYSEHDDFIHNHH